MIRSPRSPADTRTRARSAARTTATTSCAAELRVCRLRLPLPRRRRSSASRSSPTPARSSRSASDLRSADPLAFVDLRPYTERLAAAEVATGLGDAMVVGTRRDRRPLRRARDDGLQLPGRLDGQRRRREVRARRRPRARARRAAGLGRVLRRRAHAGEHPRADADGEDRAAPSTRCSEARHAVHLGARPSDDRRRDGLVRGARRRRSSPSRARCMSFAGPRVVQQTTRETLPDDFGLAESNFALRPHRRGRPARASCAARSRGCSRLFAGGDARADRAGARAAAPPPGMVARVLRVPALAPARRRRSTNGGPA